MPERKAENIGEVFFKSFGQGLQALSGILETDRQNKLQDLQLQMNMRVQEARLENLRISTAKNQEALDLMHELPEETRQRKLFEAETQTMMQEQQTQDLLEFAYTQRTGQPIHVPFQTAFAGLQQTAETQGVDFTVQTPTGAIEFGGTDSVPLDIDAINAFAGSQNLVVDDVKFDETGAIEFVSLGKSTPPTPPKTETDANRRARLKEEDRRARESVIAEANTVFQGIPQEVREKAGVGVLTDINDLKKILVEKEATGKRRFIFDWVRADNPEAKAVHDQLVALANRFSAIGGTTEDFTLDEIDEAIRKKEAQEGR